MAARNARRCNRTFEIKTGETAFLFLQHFIKSLKAGGRAAIVIKNTFLSNSDNASVSLRRELLTSCNLFTVLDMPERTFQGAGVKTVVLFFEKGAPTRKIWFYKLDPGRTLGKTTALNDADLEDFVRLQADFEDSDNSWSVDAKTIDAATYRPFGEEPQQGGRSGLARPARDYGRNRRAGRGERGDFGGYQGATVKGWECQSRLDLCQVSRRRNPSKDNAAFWTSGDIILGCHPKDMKSREIGSSIDSISRGDRKQRHVTNSKGRNLDRCSLWNFSARTNSFVADYNAERLQLCQDY